MEEYELSDGDKPCGSCPSIMGHRLDRLTHTFFQGLIEYETPRLVKVHNVWLGLIIRLCQVSVIAYVITYAILYERGYQVSRGPQVSVFNGLVSRDIFISFSIRPLTGLSFL